MMVPPAVSLRVVPGGRIASPGMKRVLALLTAIAADTPGPMFSGDVFEARFDNDGTLAD
jgi:hypothetical protein